MTKRDIKDLKCMIPGYEVNQIASIQKTIHFFIGDVCTMRNEKER